MTLSVLPGYLSHAEVERGALPRSAPDTDPLADVPASGLPIRLRVYISPSGDVRAVQVLSAIDDDAEMVSKLEAMLRATAFAPARLAGRDVPSYLDLEFSTRPVGS